MKYKPGFFIFVITIVVTQASFAQWGISGNNIFKNSPGNVGIGTNSPFSILHVETANNGLNIIAGLRNSNGTESGGNAVGIGFLNEASTTGTWWKAAIVHERTGYYGIGSLKFLVSNTTDNSIVTLNDARMTILSNGQVLIGKTIPNSGTSYKLDVNGSARFNQVTVNSTGADFVFEPSYKLKPLKEVESFLLQNHHLPDVEPAAAMQTNGVNLGDNQNKLLQKIEELTLYLISQNKTIIKQQASIKMLKQKVASIEKQCLKKSIVK